MAETREGTNAQEGASIRRRTRARGHKHAKAHPREGSQARKGAPAREGAPPRERTPAREGAPARREFNPGMRARLRWLRLAASGGGMAAASFRQRASRSVRRRLPRYFTKANLRGRDGCRCIPLRHISKCSAMGIFLRDAFSTDRQWRDLPPRCVLHWSTMARFLRDAFSAERQWQDIRLKLSPSSNRGKIFT